MQGDKPEKIQYLLKKLPKKDENALKELFWTELNFNQADDLISVQDWPESLTELLASPPRIIASAGAGDGFKVIHCCIDHEHPLLGIERKIVARLHITYPHSLYLFCNRNADQWHFVNQKYQEKSESQRKKRTILRRISISADERLRTAAERIFMLNAEEVDIIDGKRLPLSIQKAHEVAFDVEKVTRDFYNNYKAIFEKLQNTLHQQTENAEWAHDYALQFLNRIMFLYFIQRKRWLGDNPDFLNDFWQAYQKARQLKDAFVKGWLEVLFFEAFNKQFAAGRADRQYIPQDFRQALQMAPFLNGGLFNRNDLDVKYQPLISDELMKEIFAFFQRYNFTISEDTPFDQEVAVDPEMIGKVYESLVNVSAELDLQGEAGIFYTNRIEIDLMCRLALSDWLSNHLGTENKDVLFELIFAMDDEEKLAADIKIAEKGLWQELHTLIANVTLLDPACGSGSFLVGMLLILDDLLLRAEHQLGIEQSAYERRKSIIANSLYGVDVMGWAVKVAELRLWLQLMIETDMSKEDLQCQALLPSLDFKLRRGDSIVQEIGGINMRSQLGYGRLPNGFRQKIYKLKQAKLDYSYNLQGHKTKELLEHEEWLLFRDLVSARMLKAENRIKVLRTGLRPQENLFGEKKPMQMKTDHVAMQGELDELQSELSKLKKFKVVQDKEQQPPFVWNIGFVEVFEGEKRGFDIVIGNPPYVRQEKIRDPQQEPLSVTTADKKVYKEKLARSVYSAWPLSFVYDLEKDAARWKLDGKSDYYIYFYLIGLSLLNPQGSFCFITSNSWLDVGYGKDLQEFLLTRGHVILILDNEVKRSFAGTDVNTIIALLGFTQDNQRPSKESLEHTARFVMAQTPFENLLHAIFWQEIEAATKREGHPEYRVFPRLQQGLYDDGMDPEKSKFAGDKWGGKFLRAPEIYWYIMEKCKDKLVRLGDISDVRRGVTTGANEFFYLDDEKIKKWGIEEEYLVPIIKSPREFESILLCIIDFKYKLFYCPKTKKQLKDTHALKYIEYGEKRRYNLRPTCSSRNKWWELGNLVIPNAIWPKSFNEKFIYPINNINSFISDRLYLVIYKNYQEENKMVFSLNNSFVFLSTEINGRVNLGEGALDNMVFEVSNNFVIHPENVPDGLIVPNRSILPIDMELQLEDRLDFENKLFTSIGLTNVEINALHEKIIRLVEKRIKRAQI